MGADPAHATGSPARTPNGAPVRSSANSVGHVRFLWRRKGARGARARFAFSLISRSPVGVVPVDEA